MEVELIAASPADAEFVSDVQTEEYPDSPSDPAQVRLEMIDPTKVWYFHLVQAGGQPIGYAFASHHRWHESPDRFAHLEVGVLPAHRQPATYQAIYSQLEELVTVAGARNLLAFARENDPVPTSVLTARGYREERREKFWELDLAEGAARLSDIAQASRRRMAELGVTITTLAADPDPDRYRKLHLVSSEGEVDVPTTDTTVPYSFEAFMEWMQAPMIHPDRVWIARSADRVVGVSMLSYPERGVVTTEWTTVARDHRGQGIARALKVETCLQALALGVDRVRTDNDFKNAPILHLNADFGYHHIYDWITFKRDVD